MLTSRWCRTYPSLQAYVPAQLGCVPAEMSSRTLCRTAFPWSRASSNGSGRGAGWFGGLMGSSEAKTDHPEIAASNDPNARAASLRFVRLISATTLSHSIMALVECQPPPALPRAHPSKTPRKSSISRAHRAALGAPGCDITATRVRFRRGSLRWRRRKSRRARELGGAGDGVRTRDIQLGKLTLYQLSYARRVGAMVARWLAVGEGARRRGWRELSMRR